MGKEILYRAVPVEERTPKTRQTGPKVVHVLVDGRLPLMAMYVGFGNGDDWRELGTQKPIGKGITHWLERVED